MGQIFSCAGKFGRKTKCQAEKQEQPDVSSQAVQTQIEKPAPAAIQPQREDQHEKQYQTTSQVMGLPLDVMVMIFDLLEVPDAIAFSLACQGVRDHLFADARALFKKSSREDKLNVQTMLEKDLPHDQIYCPFCRTFHTLDRGYRQANCAEKDKPQLSLFATHVPGTETSTLSYLDARAITNAVLFELPCAPDHLKTLEQRFRVGSRENPWHQVWTPKVIKGELFLMIAAGHDRIATIRHKDEFVYSICKHVQIHAKFPHMWAHLSELSRIGVCKTRDWATGTCATCHADWKLWMKWISRDDGLSPRAGWDILIRSWHRLGTLRSPSDSRWAMSAGEDRPTQTRWIGGDSVHIIDHEDWDSESSGYPHTDDHGGPAEIMWRNAVEHED